MILDTVKSPGLAHLSYLLGDTGNGVCAVVDPRRDVDAYLDAARANNLRITHILETHIHADFVSGSRELAARTGAPIYAGAEGEYGFDTVPLREGDTLEIGSLTFRVLHTPGHTPEHVCFVLGGGKAADAPWAVFTGDTLFAGEVGRPDLLGGGTTDPLARKLHQSLRGKLLTLEDGVEVYPAHGKGSPCGGSIGEREQTTVGYERRHNAKLGIEQEDEFVRRVLENLPPAPAYYPRMKRINRQGPAVLGCLPSIEPLEPEAFRRRADDADTVVLDTREMIDFGGAHIAGALNIGFRPDLLALWAGWLLHPERGILLVVSSPADLEEVQRHLLRVGLDNVSGYLVGGMVGWVEAGLPFERTPQMSVHEVLDRPRELQVLDVRRSDEWEEGHVPGAVHVYLPEIPDRLDGLDRDQPVATYCGSGYRASIAASLLRRAGFRDVRNVPGSMKAWKAAGLPLSS